MGALTNGPRAGDYRGNSLKRPTVFREIGLADGATTNDAANAITVGAGTGVPTHTRAAGSVWFRTDGVVGVTDKYVSAGAGSWSTATSDTQKVANKSGAGMSAQDLVYKSGWDTTLDAPTVTLATSTDLSTRATLVLTEDIADNASGVAEGITQMDNIDTSGWTAVGTILYLDTAGGMTETPPPGATDIVQEVAVVRVKNASTGSILFYPSMSKVQGIEASDIQGLTSTAAELNLLDGVTGGTVTASLAVVVDASKDISEFRNINAALLTRDSNDLGVSSTTTGSVLVDGVDGVEVNSASGAISIGNDADAQAVNIATGAAARVITVGNAASASLTMEGGVGGIDIDCDTTFDVLAGGAVSIDGTGNSNVSAEAGNLTVGTGTSGDVQAFAADNVYMRPGAAGVVAAQDGTDPTKIFELDPASITTGNARTLTMADADVDLGSSPDSFVVPVLGPWAVNGDGAETNGGGVVGTTPLITNAVAAMCKVYDHGTTTFANCALSSGLDGWTNNFQLTADAANEQVEDAAYFGDALPFAEVSFDLTVLFTGGDSGLYEYWNGAWTTLPIAYDNTDTTAQDGLRPWQQVGAMMFVPPADWATTTVDGQLAYWIRWRVTALQVTQTPVMNAEEHGIVTPSDPIAAPWTGTITTIHYANSNLVGLAGAGVQFILMNLTTGAHSTEVSVGAGQRQDEFTGLSLAVTAGDNLGVFNTGEAGANEPEGVVLSCQGTRIV